MRCCSECLVKALKLVYIYIRTCSSLTSCCGSRERNENPQVAACRLLAYAKGICKGLQGHLTSQCPTGINNSN
jgi:hypothetical protein